MSGDVAFPDFAPAAAVDQVVQRLRRYAADLGFDSAALLVMRDSAQCYGLRPCPFATDGHAARAPIPCAGDPICQAVRRSLTPFLWSDIDVDHVELCSLRTLRTIDPAVQFASAGAIPLHGPEGSIVCLHVAAHRTATDFERLFHARAPRLQSACISALQRLTELASPGGHDLDLTERQQTVLHWIVQGKTNWEIGQILGISADTVRQHVMNIADAMGVSNRVQIAVAAVARGYAVEDQEARSA